MPWPLPTNDKDGALLALQQHDRVRSIHLQSSPRTLEKLFAAMDGMFSVLEELVLIAEVYEDESDDGEPCPRLPRMFKAPNLCHLNLIRVGDVLAVVEEGLPLLATLSGLVSLELVGIPNSHHLPLEYLASRLSLVPRLEYLGLGFDYASFGQDSRMLDHAPNVERISLPNLNDIVFKGDSHYLEGLAGWIRAPLLTSFDAQFFRQPSDNLPYLSGLLSAANKLRFPVASIKFSWTRMDEPKVMICMAGSEQTLDRRPEFSRFQMTFYCEPLSEQVARTGEICAALAPMVSAVERLRLDFEGDRWDVPGSGGYITRSRWHDLLRPFRNVMKLQIDPEIMDDLSAALRPDDDGPSVEILPELCKLVRPHNGSLGGAFDGFIATRRLAGRQVIKRRRPRIPCSKSYCCWEDEDGPSFWRNDGFDSDTELDSDTDFL